MEISVNLNEFLSSKLDIYINKNESLIVLLNTKVGKGWINLANFFRRIMFSCREKN